MPGREKESERDEKSVVTYDTSKPEVMIDLFIRSIFLPLQTSTTYNIILHREETQDF